ncbi:MAG: hypothetical protein CSB13_11620 [Chloroflexi bacterium]|nr:MAG: hypothetical protein CSB13_11620 [Chloroflexota bacterium]
MSNQLRSGACAWQDSPELEEIWAGLGQSAALIHADLEKQGQPIGAYDVLTNHATLVTHNTNEFDWVKNLQLVDWY